MRRRNAEYDIAYRKRYNASDRGKRVTRECNWRRQGIHTISGKIFKYTDYEAALLAQDNKCANTSCSNINGTTKMTMLVPDHDHSTGIFRGLLCQGCNQSLGFMKDDIHMLNGLIGYLMEAGNGISSRRWDV